jgi:hypothetical protein
MPCRLACIIGALFVAIILRYPPAIAAQEANRLRVQTVIEERQDGKKIESSCELWELTCSLPHTAAFPKGQHTVPFCRLLAVSIGWSEEPATTDTTSHLFSWLHESSRVTEVQPGIYRVEMNGRLSPCSGLDLIVKLNSTRSKIVDLTGSMRAGTQCESMSEFRPDRQSESRRIPPIWNPSCGSRGLGCE